MSYRTYVVAPTPQSEPLNERQIPNNAGGFAFALDKWKQLDRFLVLGTEGGTFYVGEQKLTRANARVVEACLTEDAKRVIDQIVLISESGLAPKNDPAILALAIASSSPDVNVRSYALGRLPRVCRIPTHLFHFVEYVKGQRGWGRGLRRAVGEWYRHNESLAYHLVKYQSRDGWSNRDLLRKAHPTPRGDVQNALFHYVTKGEIALPELIPDIVNAFEEAKTADTARLIELIHCYGLTREMLPTGALKNPDVWDALLDKMPATALLRNLSTMTRVGLVKDLSHGTLRTVEKIHRQLKSLHPLVILNAMKTYASGKGLRSTWTPVQRVVDALNDAFYASFGNVTPSNQALMLALDVSSSMSWAKIAGTGLTAAEASAAIAMVTAAVEPNYMICAFTTKFQQIGISPKKRLDDVVRTLQKMEFGGTDCAQPMLHAHLNKISVDGFAIYTDSETWAGPIHPAQALNIYRQSSGVHARLVVNGMTATQFTIADPTDAGSLDVVGFDTATPELMSRFLAGEV